MSTEVLKHTTIETFREVATKIIEYLQSLQPDLINKSVALTSRDKPDIVSSASQFPVDPEWLEFVPKSQWKEIDGRPYCSIQHHPVVLREIYSMILDLFSQEELNQLFKYLRANYENYVELNFKALKLNKLTRVERDKAGKIVYKNGTICMEEIGKNINVNSLTFHLRLLITCLGARVNDQYATNDSAITEVFIKKIKLLDILISDYRRLEQIELLENFFGEKSEDLIINGSENFADALTNILTTIVGKVLFIPTLLGLKGSY